MMRVKAKTKFQESEVVPTHSVIITCIDLCDRLVWLLSYNIRPNTVQHMTVIYTVYNRKPLYVAVPHHIKHQTKPNILLTVIKLSILIQNTSTSKNDT